MIKLEDVQKLYPWVEIIHGPYTRKGDNRKHCVLYKSSTQTKQTISYSKLLLEIKLNRKLTNDETCDHVDGNARNDSLDNLRVLTRTKNIQAYQPPKIVLCRCGKEFKKKHSTQK